MGQGYIEEGAVEDFGDYTGVGVIIVEDERIYINGALGDFDLMLRYELEPKIGYTIVRLYPKISTSDTYGDYAADILYGKSDEELENLFVEGRNYWNEKNGLGQPNYNSFEELIEYWNSMEWTDATTFEELASDSGYSNTREMLIESESVKPAEYDWNKEDEYEYYYIKYGESYVPEWGDTTSPYAEYYVSKTDTYKFTLLSEDEDVEISINIYIEVNGQISDEDLFITDGEGTILGLNSNYYSVSGCFSKSKVNVIIIPEEIGNEKITTIGENAFSCFFGITNVTIPSSVTSIENYAFYECFDLTNITIPDSVMSIGNDAFSNCGCLTSITIPNSVTSIGDSAFLGCSSLTSITIPASVTSIGRATFEYCSSLTSITIPDSVTSIGNYAFEDCSSLTSISIPDSVMSIGYSAFKDCSSLTSITIPASVTSIGEWAFAYCDSLTSITIPEGVTSIGYETFYYCSSLTSITIPEGVTSIGKQAFLGCTSLSKIYIPSSVSTIPASYVYEGPFYCCSSTLEIYCGASGEQSGWGTYWNYYSSTGTLSVEYNCTLDQFNNL